MPSLLLWSALYFNVNHSTHYYHHLHHLFSEQALEQAVCCGLNPATSRSSYGSSATNCRICLGILVLSILLIRICQFCLCSSVSVNSSQSTVRAVRTDNVASAGKLILSRSDQRWEFRNLLICYDGCYTRVGKT